ncbi:unnamed protein product [Brassica oleracea]
MSTMVMTLSFREFLLSFYFVFLIQSLCKCKAYEMLNGGARTSWYSSSIKAVWNLDMVKAMKHMRRSY